MLRTAAMSAFVTLMLLSGACKDPETKPFIYDRCRPCEAQGYCPQECRK